MATITTISTRWMVRKNGSSTNGGGFDPLVSGAGTDYSDQDAAQVTFSAGNSNRLNAAQNSQTVTSDGTPFTSAMVGNVFQVDGGTNWNKGYYCITWYPDSATITVSKELGTDVFPCTAGAGSVGTGKLGGAFQDLRNFATGSSGLSAAPTGTTSPLVPGNRVYIRSAGSDADPSIAGTPDYDWTAGWWTFPAGNLTNGWIYFVGLGASESLPSLQGFGAYRPLIKTSGIIINGGNLRVFQNLKIFPPTSPTFSSNGINNTGSCGMERCIVDTNGVAFTALSAQISVRDCWIKNTGGGATGSTTAAFTANGYASFVINTVIDGVRGHGIVLSTGGGGCLIEGNIIANVGNDGINISGGDSTRFGHYIKNNTIYNPVGHGISNAQATLCETLVFNNTTSKIASGKAALHTSATATADNNYRVRWMDYNNVYLDGGAGALRTNLSAAPNDRNVDPQFVNAGSGNYAVGVNLKALGYPGLFASGLSTAYVDIGALQRQEDSTIINARRMPGMY